MHSGADRKQQALSPSVFLEDATTSSAFLSALIENSPVAIVVLDALHRVQMCNPAFEQLFGYSQRELTDRNVDLLISDSQSLSEAEDNTRRVQRGEKIHVLSRRKRKDGTDVQVEIYGVPLVVHGKLCGIYGLYQDVTERTRADNEIRKLSGRLLQMQEEERRRIARELHDTTAQQLAAININLRRIERLIADNDNAAELIRDTVHVVNECSREVRSLSYLLHPPLLNEAGLSAAISSWIEGFERRSGITVELRLSPRLGRLADDAELALFRVVQEALANALRHSGTPVVRVALRRVRTEVLLRVMDRGHGLPASDDALSLGVGIRGMQERMTQLGGSLVITSTSRGTIVTATLPLKENSLAEPAHTGR